MATEAIIFQQIVDINWDQAIYTASPNNSINVVQFAAKGSGTNIGIALTPKGTGYISAQVPDGASSGGNARGARASDFQMSRAAADRVASGADSAAFGSNNAVSGSHSGSFAANSCTVSGLYSSALSAVSSSATGQNSVVFGEVSQCSGTYSICGGGYGINSGYCSFLFGVGGRVDSGATNSAAFGRAARAHIRGQFVIGGEGFGATPGENQQHCLQFAGKTTTNSEVELLIHGSDRAVLRSGTIWQGLLFITGSKSDGTSVASYMRQVRIKRVGNTTSLIGSVNTIGTDEAAGTSISVTADDTNESLKVAATGVSGETWRWQAVFYGGEMAYGT